MAIKAQTDQELTGEAAGALKAATSIDDLLAALEKRVARSATPAPVPKGGMIPIPSDERRRSGSNYTPRSLTEPIVRKTLEPILKRLGDEVTPEQILDLKICDPAMGSGAFLVEACRQLAEVLVKAWHRHRSLPTIPADEDELLLAKRVIAQRCLYGVDKNPMAADLAKLSLWLATLARDHPFTFLDHSLRAGDSLVGLTRKQIASFTWEPEGGLQKQIWAQLIEPRIDAALSARREILNAGDYMPPEVKRQRLEVADERLDLVRFIGDLAVAAFFAGETDKQREEKRAEHLQRLTAYLGNKGPLGSGNAAADIAQRPTYAVTALRVGEKGVTPFHWEVEFPEVFGPEHAGFDGIVGNPPFAGKNTLAVAAHERLPNWLKEQHAESHGNADLVAHFFRRAVNLLRPSGCFGLIGKLTIGQGDTRTTGLLAILRRGATIYEARKRVEWPGEAAVLVSVIHVCNGAAPQTPTLDGRPVERISAYLFHSGGDESPHTLNQNGSRSFVGSYVLGMGFTFDDTDTKGIASPVAEMRSLIAKNARNGEVIYPYVGGDEINDSPTHSNHRFVINFGDRSEADARTWPDLMTIVEAKVKPSRLKDKRDSYRKYWWQFAEKRPALFRALAPLTQSFVCVQTSKYLSWVLISTSWIPSHKTIVVASDSWVDLCILQCQAHQHWAAFFGSSQEDRPVYTPSDCFETFPFPEGFETNPRLEAAGRAYYEFRAALMVRNNEGLTKTYNRFHDPEEVNAKRAEEERLSGAAAATSKEKPTGKRRREKQSCVPVKQDGEQDGALFA